MAEYSKMKNVELEALLKQRGLPHTGKKAEMVARLEEHDRTQAKPAAATEEDQINWDDEDEAPKTAESKPAEATQKVTKAQAAAIEAGGKGPVANPQAVPNQQAAIDPSKTSDLTVKAPENGDAEPASADPPKDYTRGLSGLDPDAEQRKRLARLERFKTAEQPAEGGEVSETEKMRKRLERFGADAPIGLDQALPEKRKRGNNDEGKRGDHKRRGKSFRGRGGNRNRSQRTGGGEKNDAKSSNSWMTEEDRKRAEERKKRFATAS
jgi:SAP domain-containing ribonucleoprotein